MRAYRCTSCGNLSFPAHFLCRSCRSRGFQEVEVSDGRLLTYTVIHVPPPGVEPPLLLGIAEFQGGVRALGQLAEPMEVGDDLVAEWSLVRKADHEDQMRIRFRRRP